MTKEIEDIKKDIEKEIKRIKKKIPPALIIGLLVVLIFAALMLFFGIKISFILNEELQIELNPVYMPISARYSESPAVNFTINNRNFGFCNAFCEYTLKDLRTNIIISYMNKTLGSNQIVSKTYTLPINERGSGQALYIFEVQCNNVRTNICSTEQEKRYKSALVAVNYGLSEEEKVIEEKAKHEIPFYLNSLVNSEKTIKKDSVRISLFERGNITKSSEIPVLESANKDLEQDFAQLLIPLSFIKSLWNDEKYPELENVFSQQLKERILLHEADAKNQSLLINQTITIYNSIINLSYSLASNQDRLNEMNKYYLKTFNNKSRDVASYSERLKNELSGFEDGSITTYNESYYLFASLENEFLQLNESYEAQKKNDYELFVNYTKEFLNLTVFDSSADYCQQLQHALCSNQAFNSSIEITFSMPPIRDYVDDGGIFIETNTTLAEHYPKCCAFNKCAKCCDSCKEPYPVIFLHGHSFNKENSPESSLFGFAKMQKKLMDEGYINAGQLDIGSSLESINNSELGAMPFPSTIMVSYYYITYYDFGSYRVSAYKSDKIENYAIRLKEIIEMIREKTGREKVDIVAHSMGGLVAREYAAIFGDSGINKLIMIGTPNNGITGKAKKMCSVVGASKECEDMAEGSIFLKRLNIPKNIPKNAKFYTITAKGCDIDGEDGDGIVAAISSPLDFSQNYFINGSCTDFFGTDLHSAMLDTDKYPETYEIIREILEEKK